ncbi:hypothetical protein S245_051678, partial [Arachis hypogaea]
ENSSEIRHYLLWQVNGSGDSKHVSVPSFSFTSCSLLLVEKPCFIVRVVAARLL